MSAFPEGATHTDEFGNFYKRIGGPESDFVFFFNKHNRTWFQDLGRDFSHLIKLDKSEE